jgi:carbon-monoxide dehydrogenase medium subunit
MIPPFELHRPETVAEATQLLAALGPAARILAGGTELVLMLQEGFIEAAHLVDLKRIAGLRDIRLDEPGGLLVIGATARHDDIARNALVRERFPALAGVAAVLANPRVRNAGTIGGNLAFAEPHADPPALLVAAGGDVRLEAADGGRTEPFDGWIRGPFDPDLAEGELLTEIRIPLAGAGTAFGYERFKALERPSLTVAARIDLADDGSILGSRVVVGCLGSGPQRIGGAEAALHGARVGELEGLLPAVAEAVGHELEATTDPHGPEDYKRHLAGVLAGRALRRAADDLAGRSVAVASP